MHGKRRLCDSLAASETVHTLLANLQLRMYFGTDFNDSGLVSVNRFFRFAHSRLLSVRRPLHRFHEITFAVVRWHPTLMIRVLLAASQYP